MIGFVLSKKVLFYIEQEKNFFLIYLEQTIRRLQDELDNTTQLLESIRSKGI
jgi:hypothetical protein